MRKKTPIKNPEAFIKKTVLQFLDPRKYKVFIFGSRACGKAGKFSDYDIGVSGKGSLPLHLLSLLNESFEESDLPFRVDIVDFYLVSPRFRRVALTKFKPLL